MRSSFSIMGDSYSTFAGYIPEEYSAYYPNPEKVADVLLVEDTWWHQLMTKRNMELLENNSYSGATVCTLVRPEHKQAASFVRRIERSMRNASQGKRQPDYIVLFGCTNDNWLGRTAGEVQVDGWIEEDLEQVIPAYCYVLHQLKSENPQSRILCVLNMGLKPQIHNGMLKAASFYGATAVELQNIDISNGHPTKLGMRQIAEQIDAALF